MVHNNNIITYMNIGTCEFSSIYVVLWTVRTDSRVAFVYVLQHLIRKLRVQ